MMIAFIYYIISEVEKSLTGFFWATDDGKWEGEPGFKHSLAAYEFDFTSLKTSYEEFEEEIQKLKENVLTNIGSLQAENALHYSLLAWMHFSTNFIVDGRVQKFGFSAEPGSVFNRENAYVQVFGQINSENKHCSDHPSLSYDQTYATMTLQYPHPYVDLADCTSLLPPETFGYDTFKEMSTFSFEMDLTSLTSALSVNLGIVNIDAFEEISTFFLGLYNGDQAVYLVRYFDPRFPSMQPIVCFEFGDSYVGDDDDDDDLGSGSTAFIGKCVVRISTTIVVPSFHHFYSECQQCTESSYPICNEFDFLTNYLYFDDFSNVIDLFNRYENRLRELNDDIYSTIFVDGSLDQICGDTNCTLISLNVYDNIDQVMSPFFYNLDSGHCRDTTNKEAFDQLSQNAPSDLTEVYYRCGHSPSNAFLSSVAIANSNMLLFAPLACAIIVLPLIHAYHKFVLNEDVNPEGVVSDDVKDAALKELATRLLDITNGKVKPDANGAVGQLALDLSRLAKEARDQVAVSGKPEEDKPDDKL